jgi:hypothetical protein
MYPEEVQKSDLDRVHYGRIEKGRIQLRMQSGRDSRDNHVRCPEIVTEMKSWL